MMRAAFLILSIILISNIDLISQDILKVKKQKVVNVDILYGTKDFLIIHHGLINIDTIPKSQIKLSIIDDVKKKNKIESSSLDYYNKIYNLIEEVKNKYTIVNNKIVFIDTFNVGNLEVKDTISFFNEMITSFFPDSLFEIESLIMSNRFYNWNIKQIFYLDFPNETYKFRPNLFSHYEFSYDLKIEYLESQNKIISKVENGNIKYFHRNSTRELFQKTYTNINNVSRLEKLIDKKVEFLLAKSIDNAKINDSFGIDFGDDMTNQCLENFSRSIFSYNKKLKEALK
ncbi:MAG: hypothetical protein R2753_14270 [Chitinophagales bacterium]